MKLIKRILKFNKSSIVVVDKYFLEKNKLKNGDYVEISFKKVR